MSPLYRFHSESAEDGNNTWRLEWVPVDAEVPALVRQVSVTTRTRLNGLGMLDPTRFASEDQIDSLISEAGG
jgi:hypothetical protein